MSVSVSVYLLIMVFVFSDEDEFQLKKVKDRNNTTNCISCVLYVQAYDRHRSEHNNIVYERNKLRVVVQKTRSLP